MISLSCSVIIQYNDKVYIFKVISHKNCALGGFKACFELNLEQHCVQISHTEPSVQFKICFSVGIF